MVCCYYENFPVATICLCFFEELLIFSLFSIDSKNFALDTKRYSENVYRKLLTNYWRTIDKHYWKRESLLELLENKIFLIFHSEVWYCFLQGSLFASVTDFDHALPIWYPLAQLLLNPHIENLPTLIRTRRLSRHRMFPSRFHWTTFNKSVQT